MRSITAPKSIFGFARERNAEWDTVHRVMGRPRRPEDAFRRHAADVQTIAAQEIALDERDLRAQTGSARRADQTRGAAADHHQIVFFRRRRIDPPRRTAILEQLLVVSIVDKHHLLERRRLVVVIQIAACPTTLASCACSASRNALRAMRVTNTTTAMVAAKPTYFRTC